MLNLQQSRIFMAGRREGPQWSGPAQVKDLEKGPGFIRLCLFRFLTRSCFIHRYVLAFESLVFSLTQLQLERVVAFHLISM